MDCRLERKEVGKRGGKGTGGTQTKGPELGEQKTDGTNVMLSHYLPSLSLFPSLSPQSLNG
jgi:hypothetical protein